MNIVTRKLIAKEFHVNRYIVAGASVGGVLSALIAALGKTGFNIGSLMWITIIIANGVMLAIYGISYERKEQALLFVLSLPLSIGDYVRAKQIGLAVCFFIPWLTASIAAVALVLAQEGIADGIMPFTVLLCVFMLANFSLVLCGALHAMTEAATSAVIIVTNMGVSIFMFSIAAIPAIGTHMFEPQPVWNDTFWTILAIEILTLVLAFIVPQLVAARRRDFI